MAFDGPYFNLPKDQVWLAFRIRSYQLQRAAATELNCGLWCLTKLAAHRFPSLVQTKISCNYQRLECLWRLFGSSMQYQGSPDSFSSDPLSLSLSKFSYSVVPEDSNAPIPWIHLTSKGNLLAVFQNCRTWDYLGHPQDQSRFKVSNGTQTMV